MDFVVGLPRTWRGKDAVWMVIDQPSKVAHFIPIRTTYCASDFGTDICNQIVSLHRLQNHYFIMDAKFECSRRACRVP
jgi:hypothetical protein